MHTEDSAMLISASNIYQFKVTLHGTMGSEQKSGVPDIWRRILVPGTYNFHDFHLTIKRAMGWDSFHLHHFRIINPITESLEIIGIPNEYGGVQPIPEDTVKIAQYFVFPETEAIYEYDFSNGWIHDVVLESIVPAIAGAKYPQCIAGERACPPEDCGGISGFEELLKALANSDDEEFETYQDWMNTNGYEDYDPDFFEPDSVDFDFAISE